MKGVIYARYSSDNQREESIEGQLRECKEYAERNDITILGTYIDRALSAKTDNRPEFQHMIKESAKGLFDVVLVWKLDRFARNRYDSARYKNLLKKNGVKVISARENISEGSEGIILEAMLEGYAEYYSAELSEKVIRGLTDNALKCKYNGGTVPMGYYIDEQQYYQIDPKTAPVVLEMFTKYSEGATMQELVNLLNSRGMRSIRGGKITLNIMNHLLKNRRYMGEYSYRDVVKENGIPAIVPKELFERVQERLAKNKKAPARHKAEDDYLLTTKLYCGKCGSFMVGESGTSHTMKVHRYYRCVNTKKKKLCDKKAVKKDWIEDLVVNYTMKAIMNDEVMERLIDTLMELQKKESTDLPLLKKQLAETEKGINNMLNAIQAGIFTPSTKQRLDELEETKSQLEVSILQEEMHKPLLTREQIAFFIYRFRKFDVTKREQRQRLIDSFVNAVYLYEDKIILTFNYKDGSKTITLAEVEGSDLSVLGAPKIRPSAFGGWSYFGVPLPVAAQPQGDRTCPEQVNCPCARILLRKILVTAHPRRLAVWEHGSVGVHTAASWPDGTGLTLALPHYSNILRFCYRCPKPLYFAKNWGILASGRRGDRMEDYTRKFNAAKEKDEEIHHILTSVYTALEEKGYNPINQLVGYILSEDPTYITNHRQARTLIRKLDRDELLQVLLRSYLSQ